MEYIFGKNTIDSFIDSNNLVEVFITDSFDDAKILGKLRKANIKITIKNKNFLDSVSNGGKHQGIVASIKKFEYASLEKVLEKGNTQTSPLIVMLDGIEDPHNLGAIIRTCEAFDVAGIIIPKNGNCQVNATVAKTSTGTIANVNICQVTNLTQTIKKLKEEGYWAYAAEAFNSQPYETLDYNSKTLLIVGSEGFGISRLVKEQADFNIRITTTGKVNSLNVSVATAILISYISLHK